LIRYRFVIFDSFTWTDLGATDFVDELRELVAEIRASTNRQIKVWDNDYGGLFDIPGSTTWSWKKEGF